MPRASSPKRGLPPGALPFPKTGVGARIGRPRRKPETLTLRFSHFVADTVYRGTVTVPPAIAETLREQETRAAQAESKLRDTNPLATVVLEGGYTRKVAPEALVDMAARMALR